METRSAMLCRLSVLACVCLCVLRQVSCDVFLDSPSANQLLARRRRANSPFEEWRQGDMERECVEERCDREEAREIFENEELTNEFWHKYYDGDACESNPCAHSGVCKDGIGQYTCFCPIGYQGYNCEIVIPELCENKNGGCDHFCDVTGGNVRCSCADGYYLEADEKSCNSNQTYKCGAVFAKGTRTVFHYVRPNVTATDANGTEQSDIPAVFDVSQFTEPFDGNMSSWPAEGADDYMMDGTQALVEEEPHLADVSTQTRIVGGEQCPPGDCPWQALLMNEEKRGFCGGTILTDYIILTAAHCINQSRYIYVVLGEFDIEVNEGRESKHNVERVLMHRQYKPDTFHNDIALIKLTTPVKFTKFIIPACMPEKDFAEKVLMREPDGLVSGWGRIGEGLRPSAILQRLTMPYVDRAVCMESSQFRISSRMFCAGYDDLKKDSCHGDSGGPHVTRYKNTYFVTGVVSWGEGCAREGKFGVYTQISKYIGWLKNGIARLTPKPHPNESASQGARKRRDTAPFPIIRM